LVAVTNASSKWATGFGFALLRWICNVGRLKWNWQICKRSPAHPFEMCGAFYLPLKNLVPCVYLARCPISFGARLSGCWGGFYLDWSIAPLGSCLLPPVIIVSVTIAPITTTVVVVPVPAISAAAVIIAVALFPIFATAVVARAGCPAMVIFVFAVMLAILLTVFVLFGFFVFLAFVAIAIASVIAIVAAAKNAKGLLCGLMDFLCSVRGRLGTGIGK